MPKIARIDPVERKQLRKELKEKYRSQANYIHLNGKPSSDIAAEIDVRRRRLKKVDRKSVGFEYEEKAIEPHAPRNPRRLKIPWSCSRPECENKILEGQEKIMFKKRHYCSTECALLDGGITTITIEYKKQS